MELNHVVLEERKIMGDIGHCFNLYILSELLLEDEVKEALEVMLKLCKDFRDVHVELKTLLGDDYEKTYPLYENTYNKLFKYIKDAKEKLRGIRTEVENCSLTEEKKSLKIQWDVLLGKVAHENDSMDLETAKDEQEVGRYILKMEKFIDVIFELCGKMKSVDFDEFFEQEISETTLDIRQDIKMAKIWKQELLKAKERVSKFAVFQKDQVEYVTRAENLNAEISYRFKYLSKKFVSDLDDLSDYQILEIYQDKTLDSEFNDILEKVTELASLGTLGGDPVEKMLSKVCKTRNRIALKKDAFYDKLSNIIIERDITPEKMKNAAALKIELPKFTGYDARIDFFTFKSEFTRLVESTVQKKFWVDHLKRNYLGGQASTLVESEVDYDKIWQRLKESFGSPRLLLQNKLSLLDKMGGLYLLKEDHKIGTAVARLCNSMQDLSKVAAEHDLEGQLYEGGGLEKVMSLIGESRHRKFRSENLSSVHSKKQEWQKLYEFLKKERILREKLALDHKMQN